MSKSYQGLIQRYRSRLPLDPNSIVVSLNEGNTPLLQLQNLPKKLNMDLTIYVKYEGLNPTGSFKDRGMTVAVSHAKSQNSQAVICASTGNTSASAAAYAARAGMQSFVIIPEGKIAMGKLAQAIMHGAVILQIAGNFDDGMRIVKSLTEQLPISLVNSVNPYRIQGQKTAAFEIIDELQISPTYHCLPVGNAGNITAYWLGYNEYYNDKIISTKPIMLGYQAAGAAPLVLGKPVLNPETVATAIRIGQPQSAAGAINATTESKGWFRAITDEDILHAQFLLAANEGIFCEPASAISLAGLIKDYADDKIKKGSQVVCTLTGHGLKDPDIALQNTDKNPLQRVAAEEDEIKILIEKQLGN